MSTTLRWKRTHPSCPLFPPTVSYDRPTFAHLPLVVHDICIAESHRYDVAKPPHTVLRIESDSTPAPVAFRSAWYCNWPNSFSHAFYPLQPSSVPHVAMDRIMLLWLFPALGNIPHCEPTTPLGTPNAFPAFLNRDFQCSYPSLLMCALKP